MLNKLKKIKFPKDFWNIKRPESSFKETLHDIEPISWNENKSKKVIIYSAKEKS